MDNELNTWIENRYRITIKDELDLILLSWRLQQPGNIYSRTEDTVTCNVNNSYCIVCSKHAGYILVKDTGETSRYVKYTCENISRMMYLHIIFND
jgi:hypothetical protein